VGPILRRYVLALKGQSFVTFQHVLALKGRVSSLCCPLYKEASKCQ